MSNNTTTTSYLDIINKIIEPEVIMEKCFVRDEDGNHVKDENGDFVKEYRPTNRYMIAHDTSYIPDESALTGSEKQVEWAKSIRESFIKYIKYTNKSKGERADFHVSDGVKKARIRGESTCEIGDDYYAWKDGKKLDKRLDTDNVFITWAKIAIDKGSDLDLERVAKCLYMLAIQTEASVWIELRDYIDSTYIDYTVKGRMLFKEFIERIESTLVADYEATTKAPEKICLYTKTDDVGDAEAVVTMTITEDKVIVKYPYHSKGTDIMHLCNYEWDRIAKSWKRYPDIYQSDLINSACWAIKEFLEAGFAVKVDNDPEIVRRLQEGDWEKDHERIVDLSKDGKSLLISFPARDKDLRDEVASIGGIERKWDKYGTYYYKIRKTNYKSVAEFAERCGFTVTDKAMKDMEEQAGSLVKITLGEGRDPSAVAKKDINDDYDAILEDLNDD